MHGLFDLPLPAVHGNMGGKRVDAGFCCGCLFTVLFGREQLGPYLTNLLFYGLAVILSRGVPYTICAQLPLQGWSLLMVRGLICCVVPNAMFLAAYGRMPEFRDSLSLIDRVTKGKISFLNKWCRE